MSLGRVLVEKFQPEVLEWLSARAQIVVVDPWAEAARWDALARGGVVDEEALYRWLSEGRIAGAAIDVLETEPPRKDHPLIGLDNVIFSPHIGGAAREATSRGERGAAEEVVRVLEGQRPRNPVIQLELA